ncbi:MAG: VWA domain-containing protein [Deltaproteobacteria bacterium]|nr:VWA domain-containing protein [Deltaproteobacteria bacterium]
MRHAARCTAEIREASVALESRDGRTALVCPRLGEVTDVPRIPRRDREGRALMALVCLATSGCAAAAEDDPDAAVDPVVEIVSDEHLCRQDALMSDFWNCGECGAVCEPTEADRCEEGHCACGMSSACGAGADCRFGRCVPPDLAGANCEFDAECTSGQACIEGRCTTVQCDDEACDGIDNDCDGEIDEGEGGPLSEWCSSSPAEELMPPCQRGVRVCVQGEWTECMGEIPPLPEVGLLRCDGRDNDCDQCVDGTLVGGLCISEEPVGYDVVYLMDVSGSMQGTIDDVKEATRSFSARFSQREEFRFGIVLIPSETGEHDFAAIHTNLTDFDSFDAALSTVNANGGYGLEPQWDAVYEIATGELPLAFREDAVRILILFTDEEGQSYRALRGLSAVDEAAMCESLSHGEVLAVVSDPPHVGDFDDCSVVIEMADSEQMERDLDQVISDPCG